MKVSLSPRDRYTVFFHFASAQTWGGTEEDLETRLKAWEQLRLSDFDSKDVDQTKLSNVDGRFEISKDVADHVVKSCSCAGQNVSLGIFSARLVRKIRAVHPAPKPTNDAHP